MTNSVAEFIEEKVEKWAEYLAGEHAYKEVNIPVVTVSMEPGSQGYLIAKRLSELLEFDLFHTEILDQVAKTGNIHKETLAFMEKERYTGLKDFISSLFIDHYIHQDTYLKHLKHVIESMGRLGKSVIVGRGANFILPPAKRFSIRVVAPMDVKIKNVMAAYNASETEAKKRIHKRESAREAFIKSCFHKNIASPKHYDLVINTGVLSVEAAAWSVIGAIIGAQSTKRFGTNSD